MNLVIRLVVLIIAEALLGFAFRYIVNPLNHQFEIVIGSFIAMLIILIPTKFFKR